MSSQVWLMMADSIKSSVAFYWHWLNSQANLDIAWTVIECSSFDFCFLDSDILHDLHYPFTPTLPLTPSKLWPWTNESCRIPTLHLWAFTLKHLSRKYQITYQAVACMTKTDTHAWRRPSLWWTLCISLVQKLWWNRKCALCVSSFSGGKVGSWVCLNGSILSSIKK